MQYNNDYTYFWLQEAEEVEENMRKEMRELKLTIAKMHKEIGIKRGKIEALQDEVSCYK